MNWMIHHCIAGKRQSLRIGIACHVILITVFLPLHQIMGKHWLSEKGIRLSTTWNLQEVSLSVKTKATKRSQGRKEKGYFQRPVKERYRKSGKFVPLNHSVIQLCVTWLVEHLV